MSIIIIIIIIIVIIFYHIISVYWPALHATQCLVEPTNLLTSNTSSSSSSSSSIPVGTTAIWIQRQCIKSAFWSEVNLRQTSQRDAFCDAWKALKSVFGQGSALDPGGGVGAHDAPPDSVVAWGCGSLFTHPSTLSAPAFFPKSWWLF